MKMKALFLSLLLSLAGIAEAEVRLFDIQFSDGRECHKCTYQTKQGFVVSVKDSKGEEWLDPTKPMALQILKSGFWSWSSNSYTTSAGAPLSKENPSLDTETSQPTSIQPPSWDEFRPLFEIGPYWTQRRIQFDKEINLCRVMQSTSEQAMCYMQVRQIESSKNSMRKIQMALP